MHLPGTVLDPCYLLFSTSPLYVMFCRYNGPVARWVHRGKGSSRRFSWPQHCRLGPAERLPIDALSYSENTKVFEVCTTNYVRFNVTKAICVSSMCIKIMCSWGFVPDSSLGYVTSLPKMLSCFWGCDPCNIISIATLPSMFWLWSETQTDLS